MTEPLVTILIPSYNYAQFIAAAVDSGLAQHHRNVEVLVMDNVSTDNTLDVLAQYANEPRVRVIVNERNLGRAGNLNRGIAEAHGEYLVIMAADDALLPGHVSSALQYYQTHPWIDVLHRQFIYTDEALQTVFIPETEGYIGLAAYEQRDELFGLLRYYSYAQLVTALIPKWVFDRVGAFDEELTVAFDFGYMTRIAAAGIRFAFRDEPVYLHRRHGENASGMGFVKSGKACTEYLRVLETHVDAPQFAEVAPSAFELYEGLAGRPIDGEGKAAVDAARPRADALRARHAELAARPSVLPANPLVTVIIPAGNDVNGLDRALRSLETQTHTNWEVELVAYEGADLDMYLGRYAFRERIHYARLATRGPSASPATARNAGLQLARGDVITFLSDRETFATDHLTLALEAMRSTETNLVRCGMAITVEQTPHPEGIPPDKMGMYVLPNEPGIARTSHPYPPLATIAHQRLPFSRGFRNQPYFSEWLYILMLISAGAKCASYQKATAAMHIPVIDAEKAAVDMDRVLESLDFVYRIAPATEQPEVAEQRRLYRANLIAAAEGVRNSPNDGRAIVGFILARDALPMPVPA